MSPVNAILDAFGAVSDLVVSQTLRLFPGAGAPIVLALLTLAPALALMRVGKTARRLKRARDLMTAHALEIYIYRDGDRAVAGAIAGVALSAIRYGLAMIPPMLILALPLGSLWAAFDRQQRAEIPTRGITTLVAVSHIPFALAPQVDASGALRLESPPITDRNAGVSYYRLWVDVTGTPTLHLGESPCSEDIRWDADREAPQPRHDGESFLYRWIEHQPNPLPSCLGIRHVAFDYPARPSAFLQWPLSPLAALFLWTMLLGLLLGWATGGSK